MKACKVCSEAKPETAFRKRSAVRSTRRNECRVCERKWLRAHRGQWENLSRNLRSRYGARLKMRDLRVGLGDPATCHICGQPITGSAELDHVTPLSRGGLTEIANLRWTHRGCNRMKHDLTMDEMVALLETILTHHRSLK